VSNHDTPVLLSLNIQTDMVRNINVFGLVFVTSFAVVVTLIDLIILKYVIFFRKTRQKLAPRIDRWIQDGIFQFQRRAYETQKDGIWDRLEREIPTTVTEHLLSDLPLETPSTQDQGPQKTATISE
jgi:hypothetical protein